MADSTVPFPSSVREKLFKTDRGDLCLCLHEAWPSLLIDLGLLGPVVIVSRSEQLAIASYSLQLEFLAVPGSTEMLDVGTGLCLDTERLGAVIAGQEAKTDKLSLQFFDRTGFGLFKVMMASGGDIDGFAQIVEHYARDPRALHPPEPMTERTFSCQNAVMAVERNFLLEAWEKFPPALGNDFVPGLPRVSWWDALHLARPDRARPFSKAELIKAVLAAHHYESPLRFTAWCGGWQQQTVIVPRRLERCSQCFHFLDVTNEAHFFFESDFEAWVGFHGKHQAPAIHLFATDGHRRGVIQFEQELPEDEEWQQALFEV